LESVCVYERIIFSFEFTVPNFETGNVAPIVDPGAMLTDKALTVSILGNNYTLVVEVPIVTDYWVFVPVIRPANCLIAASLASDNAVC
jgi:hypothetical protein